MSTNTKNNDHDNENDNNYLDIIHFNDIYHIEELDSKNYQVIGGASRFKYQLDWIYKESSRKYNKPPANVEVGGGDGEEEDGDVLVFFSGDAFNPSIQSTITKGSHMVPVLNRLRIDAACFGNHDFDFGVPVLEELAEQCNFPWLLSNIAVNESNKETPLAHGKRYHILERRGFKVGVIGLVEKEWLLTIASLPPDYYYMDFIETGRSLARELRDEHNVDFVVALTHMRLPNDEALAQACQEEIDLILGGHDHFFHVGSGCDFLDSEGNVTKAPTQSQDLSIPDLRVVKSGTDFRTLSHVRLTKKRKVQVTRYTITKDVPRDREVEKLVEKTQGQIWKKLKVIIGYRAGEWDTRSESVRLEESAIGNLIADIFLNSYPEADLALLCGGALRSDTVYPPGPVTLGDILAILPFDDPVVVLALKGADLLEALESSLSMVPKQEGRFPQVSGLKLTFDPLANPGSRVVDTQVLSPDLVYVPLDPNKTYKVVTRDYMALGFDGFDALKRGKYIVDEESGMMASTLMRRFFLGLKYSALISGKTVTSANDAALAAARLWRCKALVGKGLPTFYQCLCTSVIPHPNGGSSSSNEEEEESTHSCLDEKLRPFITVDPKLEGRIIRQA